ncbi:hypothetical protein [Neobacillus rhizophilus]|uniref:Uncharacterized protein n=1 Tax=Neobacillus rhizophilus TaxID=2833579 RepID=A0A942YU15_9BACI|nr:hypothetical protein [Neobacillus rhizophilus]MBS4212699.1 hypothetical protein [Neobacillus rhizophilus]
MRIGEQKTFIYFPSYGFIKVSTAESQSKQSPRMSRQVEQEERRSLQQLSKNGMSDASIREMFEKAYPGHTVVQNGNEWTMIPNENLNKEKFKD